MEDIWKRLFNAAESALNPRKISRNVEAGGVAAAVQSASGKIYSGVCVDTACSIGVCAERNAIFSMITAGESTVRRIIAIDRNLKTVPPCGVCREFMVQLMPESYGETEVMLDYSRNKIVKLKDLTPEWWV